VAVNYDIRYKMAGVCPTKMNHHYVLELYSIIHVSNNTISLTGLMKCLGSFMYSLYDSLVQGYLII